MPQAKQDSLLFYTLFAIFLLMQTGFKHWLIRLAQNFNSDVNLFGHEQSKRRSTVVHLPFNNSSILQAIMHCVITRKHDLIASTLEKEDQYFESVEVAERL